MCLFGTKALQFGFHLVNISQYLGDQAAAPGFLCLDVRQIGKRPLQQEDDFRRYRPLIKGGRSFNPILQIGRNS